MGKLETTGIVGNFRKIFAKSYSIIKNGVLEKFDERDLIDGKYVVPSSVIKIGEMAFKYCINLKAIEIPSNVKKIDTKAFYGCKNLKSISLNDGLESIGEEAFYLCPENWIIEKEEINSELLTEMVIPETVYEIGEGAFNSCYALRSLKLSPNIKDLEPGVFYDCANLETVEIPEGVEVVGSCCFSSCDKLKKIVFPKSVKRLSNDVLSYCENLKEVTILNDKIDIEGILKLPNIEKINIPATIVNKLPLNILLSDKVFADGEKYRLPDRFKILSEDVYECLIEKHTFEDILNIKLKGLNNVCKHIFGENYNPDLKEVKDLKIACYHLGVLGEDAQLAQTMGEFLKNLHDKNMLNSNILAVFANMENKGENKDFSIFFKDNYNSILKKLEESSEENIEYLLTEIHNNFDELAKSFVSDNAAARQKKPTFDFFVSALDKNRFGENIDEKYSAIAKEMSKFSFYNNEDFEKACSVYDKYLELSNKKMSPSQKAISDCIKRAFNNMDTIENNIVNNLQEATANIGKSIAQEETWEWLEKNDALNFTLGLYCNCCARIGGAGEGIAIASILDPNVRNLVIKDKNGRPMAKGTIYVNSKDGYALFNNFEVANGVKEEKKAKAYELLKEATNNFVKNYNKEAAENHIPAIKKVNVGMGQNDLDKFLTEKSSEILAGVYFSKYSGGGHIGDWNEGQYVFFNPSNEKTNEGLTI